MVVAMAGLILVANDIVDLAVSTRQRVIEQLAAILPGEYDPTSFKYTLA